MAHLQIVIGKPCPVHDCENGTIAIEVTITEMSEISTRPCARRTIVFVGAHYKHVRIQDES